MGFLVLADGVVALHLLFVVFVVLGGLLAWRWPRIAWVHLPAAAWGAWVELAGQICPLTPLETWLRERAGAPGYTSGFVEHYLLPLLYPASLTREMQWALGAAVVLVNAAVYAAALRRRRRRARARKKARPTSPDGSADRADESAPATNERRRLGDLERETGFAPASLGLGIAPKPSQRREAVSPTLRRHARDGTARHR